MRFHRETTPAKGGFTLLEMTIVIMILLALMGTGLFFSGKYKEWQLGRQASETLRTVYSAQRTFLADNPTMAVANITPGHIRPYLPGSRPGNDAPMPTITALNGAVLQIRVSVTPPHAVNGVTRYDPSGSHTDLLWDVGETGP